MQTDAESSATVCHTGESAGAPAPPDQGLDSPLASSRRTTRWITIDTVHDGVVAAPPDIPPPPTAWPVARATPDSAADHDDLIARLDAALAELRQPVALADLTMPRQRPDVPAVPTERHRPLRPARPVENPAPRRAGSAPAAPPPGASIAPLGVHVFGAGPVPALPSGRGAMARLAAVAGLMVLAGGGAALVADPGGRLTPWTTPAANRSAAPPAMPPPAPFAAAIAGDGTRQAAPAAAINTPGMAQAGADLDSTLSHVDALMQGGDVSAARLVLTQVAEAEDPRVLAALARTHDPVVLRRLGTRDPAADTDTARRLYERAARAGLADATAALAALQADERPPPERPPGRTAR